MPVKRIIGTGTELHIIPTARGRAIYITQEGFTGGADTFYFRNVKEVEHYLSRIRAGFTVKYDVPTTFYIYETPEGEEYICDEDGKEWMESIFEE